MPRLSRGFFNRNTVLVAKGLLGKYLCRRIGNIIVKARITETEAYCGQRDLACHASKGLTERTKVMFDLPGHAYVYLIYGMHHCFNIVTERKGYPAAVLVRGCGLVNNESRIMNYGKGKNKNPNNNPNSKFTIHNLLLDGPGKLCRALKIDRNLNSVDMCGSRELWIEDGGEKPTKIKLGKRIGVDYAGKWKNKLWRFYL